MIVKGNQGLPPSAPAGSSFFSEGSFYVLCAAMNMGVCADHITVMGPGIQPLR